MAQPLHSRKELEIQVADLRSQLAEKQELLNAICSGAVDALVVPGPNGTWIYSLKGAEQPYRVLTEEMSEGAATLASDGTVLYCNRRLADLVRAPLESVIGSAFASFLAPSDRPGFVELLERAHHGRTQGQACRHDDSSSVLQLSLKPLPPGAGGAVSVIAVDISERVAAQQRAESQLALLLDSTAEGLFGMDMKGNCTFANRACLDMLGYTSPEAVLGRPVHSIARHGHADGTAYAANECPIHRALRQGAGTHADNESFGRADGTSFPVEYWSHPVTTNGKLVGAVLAFVDISERKRNEQALRDTLERYRALIDTTCTGYVIIDGDGRVVDANPEYVRLTGNEALPDILGRRVTEWTAPSDMARNAEAVRRCNRDGLIRDFEIEYIDEQGKCTPVEINATAVLRPGGVQILGLVRDITERKRAEEARALLASIVESSDDAIIGHTLEGKIASWNRGAEALFGYPSEEVIGKPVFMFIAPEEVAHVERTLAEACRDGKAAHVEGMAVRKGGERFAVCVTVSSIQNGTGQCVGWAAIIRDITERKRIEETLQRAGAELREALAAAQMGVWTWIEATGAITWDENMCKIAGRDPQSPPPTFEQLSQFYTANSWERLMSAVSNALTTGTPYEVDLELVRSDGAKRWTVAHGQPLRGSDGQIIGLRGTAQDITERKRAEESRALLASIVETSEDAIIAHTPEGIIASWNRGAEALYGYTAQEAVGKPVSTMIAPERAGDWPKVVSRLERGEAVCGFEGLAVRKDGSKFEISGTLSPIIDTAGNFAGSAAIIRDITERKRTEESLRESETRLQEIFASVQTGIVIIDPEGHRIVDANPVALQAIGSSREHVLGAECHQFICPAERGRCPVTDLGQTIDNCERVLLTATGGKRAIMKTVVPVLVRGKKHLLESFVDITELKRAEETRQRANAYRSLIEASLDPLVTISREGKITDVNAATEAVTGLARQQLIGTDFADYFTDPARAKTGYQQVFSEGRVQDFELGIRHREGHATPVLYNASVYRNEQGEVCGVFAAARDISERKRAEAKVRQLTEELEQRVQRRTAELTRLNAQLAEAVDKAEEASRAKSQFLANMSHEIRTPMNGILGMTELAQATELTVEQQEYLGMIKSSADSLLVVINDILDLSKIEAGKLDLEMVDFDLADTVEPALKALALQAAQKGLELNFQVQPEVPSAVITDPNRLRQVLVNLVGNAIKFTERGEVNVRVASEAGAEGTHWLRFSIQDTGIGIPPGKQLSIFDAFSQADGSSTRRYGGTGLGLTISRQLVEMMGGRLSLKSVPGEGSTFSFTLPLRVGQAHKSAPAPTVDLEGLSVLVVDDNHTNRRILEEVLLAWSMRPTLAGDARTGLSHLERESAAGRPFPLVLLDRNMPEVDGFALVEQIRQNPQLAEPAMIMLTSAGQPGEVTRCRELGVAAHLVKPVGQTELREAILRALAANPTATAAPEARQRLQTSARPLRVLLAEDNLVNQKVVCRLLEKQGHQVEIAANGREALDRVSRGSYDVVLMDVQMPEMDGLEATAALRKLEQHSGGHLPVIGLTAHAMNADRERCLAGGMDGYLTKPVRPADLFRQIEQVGLGHTRAPAIDPLSDR